MNGSILSNPGGDVLHCAGRDDLLLVTFNDMTTLANGRRFWGQAMAEKYGLSAVGVVTARPSWFPESFMAEAIPAVREIARRFDRVVVYGYSMGAYAALKYAAAVGADHVLAFSPQYSIDPAVTAAHDRRYAAHFDPAQRGGLPITAADTGTAEAFAIFDPAHVEDAWNVRQLPPSVHRIPLHHMAHETVRAVTGGQAFLQMLDGLRAGQGLDRASLRRGRQQVPHFLAHLAFQAARRKHPAWAQALAQRSFARIRGSEEGPSLLLSEVFKRTGHYAEALTCIDRAIRVRRNAFLLLKKAEIYAQSGDAYQARFMLAALAAEFADHPEYRRISAAVRG